MSTRPPLNVVVAGGGVAAVEFVLALHELAGRRVQITLVAPNEQLDVRALRTLASLTGTAPPQVPLARVAARSRARVEHTTLRGVHPEQRLAELGDGRRLPYEVLVIATGARPVAAYGAGVATFGTDAGGDEASAALGDLRAGRASSAAFVVPPGVAWTLPLYELVLLSAQQLREQRPRLMLVTPEAAPLAIFGSDGARAAEELLRGAGVELHLGAYASVEAPGRIELRPHTEILEADRILALPRQVGRAPQGVSTDAGGFIAVDDHGRVAGADADGVYAIGDVTTFPVKQGGLACQQADATAATIAAQAGADVEPLPFRPVLRGQLLAGARTLHLDSPIAGGGGAGAVDLRAIWRPAHKVDGLHLSRLLEGERDFTTPPVGIDVMVRLASPSRLARDPLSLDPYSPTSTLGVS